MKVTRGKNRTELLTHREYRLNSEAMLVLASGPAWLFVGGKHHLKHDEVADLVGHLTAWLETGSLDRRSGGDAGDSAKHSVIPQI